MLGTMGVTIVAMPVNVGRFVGSDGRAPVVDPDPPVPVIVGSGGPEVVAVVPPVCVPVFVPGFLVFVAADVFPVFNVAVERLGRAESVAAADCADVLIASSKTARADERSGVLRKSLMMYVLSKLLCERMETSLDEERGEGGCLRFVVLFALHNQVNRGILSE